MQRWITGIAVAATLATPAVNSTTSPAAADQTARPAVRSAPGKTARITLITGDQVIVSTRPGSPDQVIFRPRPGSGSKAALISHSRGRTFAVPSAALREVTSGRLDRRLFDVTTLIEQRYDDQHAKTIPVIIEYAASPRTTLTRSRPGRLLDSIGAHALSIPKAATATFPAIGPFRSPAGARIKRLWLDRRFRMTLDRSTAQIGVPAARKRGLTGKGVKVAVLDSGIDTSHPDLRGKVVAAANFSGSKDVQDRAGHGTHVASTIAGTGAASKGRYRGVAPGASLLNGKVLDDQGNGSESGIIAGMEWAVRRGARIVNLSLGTDDASDGRDPVSAAINRLTRSTGTLFVVAAGNCSPSRSRIGSPGAADLALTVANLDRNGALNPTSCRGPRTGDHALKPEIAAPGTRIVAARSAGSELGEPVSRYYQAMSGTSMATPHVAGTAALLKQQNPRWTGPLLRLRLISTADPMRDSPLDSQGAGRVDADQATVRSVSVNTGELDFGSLRWPHPPKPRARTVTVTYTNSAARAVTLNLIARLDPGDTGRAPTLSPNRIVVPAGGQARVTVTGRPGEGATGRHTGRILATPAAGGDPVLTTFGWFLEPEMYDLTIRGSYTDGTPADGEMTFVERPDGGEVPDYDGLAGPDLVDGVAKTRVRPGVYTVSSMLFEEATDKQPDTYSLLVEPEVRITKNTTVVLDARKAVPAGASMLGDQRLQTRNSQLTYLRRDVRGEVAAYEDVQGVGAPIRLLATPTQPVSIGQLEYTAGARLAVPPYRARTTGLLGRQLPVFHYAFGGPKFTGTKRLVGHDGVAGSRGKLAVVRRAPGSQISAQAAAAQRAGAAAVLLYDPNKPGVPAEQEFDGEGVTIPTMHTDRSTARELLEQIHAGGVRVEITGVAASPVVYDLAVPWAERIPDQPAYRAWPHEFARIDERFGGHASSARGTDETRSATTPLGSQLTASFEPVPTPSARTGYVLAGPVRWDQRLVVGADGPDGLWWITSAKRYRAGERTSVRWFVPVVNSGLPAERSAWASAVGVTRRGGLIWLALAPFTRGPAQYEDPEFVDTGEYLLRVRRDGVELGTGDLPLGVIPVPPTPATYQIDLDARRQLPSWRYSTRIRSSWTFRSRAGANETFPLVLADLELPSASALNTVRAGRSAALNIGLRHQTGGPAPRFTSARASISYDGKTWTALSLAPSGRNRFVALVNHPAARAGQAVSLRLDIRDEAGGRLQQEITRAYGVAN